VRLGILGGSFDPPHVGHLLVAVDAYEVLALDRLVFIPAAIQPLKAGKAVASPAQRLEMVRRLIADDDRFAVDSIEADRAGVSFSVDTVTDYARRHPGAELFFLIGADVVGSLESWRHPERISELATIVVVHRGEERVPNQGRFELRTLHTRRIDVSSTEIRDRIRAGKSIQGFVPPAVAEYIASTGLYQ
jgi:nicotinate-nucleotide adenylyltransferase